MKINSKKEENNEKKNASNLNNIEQHNGNNVTRQHINWLCQSLFRNRINYFNKYNEWSPTTERQSRLDDDKIEPSQWT